MDCTQFLCQLTVTFLAEFSSSKSTPALPFPVSGGPLSRQEEGTCRPADHCRHVDSPPTHTVLAIGTLHDAHMNGDRPHGRLHSHQQPTPLPTTSRSTTQPHRQHWRSLFTSPPYTAARQPASQSCRSHILHTHDTRYPIICSLLLDQQRRSPLSRVSANMSSAAGSSPPVTSLLFSHPLALLRTSSYSGRSLSSGLMLDMPNTPTNERRLGLHSSLPFPASTSSYPVAASGSASSPATSPTAASSAPATDSPASSFSSPPLRAQWRAWLIGNVVPLFSNKYTRLIVSLILLTFNVIVLYFGAFAFYLTHFLSRTADDSSFATSCSSFPLSLFLVFLVFRSMCSLLLIGIRMRDSSMWVNQRSQMSRRNQFFHLISLALFLLSAAALSLGYTWLASSESKQCVQLAQPLVAAIVVYETLAVLWPLAVLAALSRMFPWTALSPFAPYIPLTSETFVAEKRGLSRREIASLPSFVYATGLYVEDDRRCSICLADVEPGEKLRQLRCSHRFHQPCVDEWLLKKPTCPLCVQKVEAERKQRHFRFSFSRTRRQSSPNSGVVDGAETSVSERSRAVETSPVQVEQHDSGLEADGVEDALEMV